MTNPYGTLAIVCRSCRTPYPLPFRFRDTTTVTFRGSAAECPRCRTLNPIPDGTYSFVDAVLESIILERPDTLRTLIHWIDEAREKGADNQKIAEEIAKRVPSARDLIPKDASQLAQSIGAIVVMLSLVLQHCEHSPESKPAPQLIVNQTVQVLQQHDHDLDRILKAARTGQIKAERETAPPRKPKTRAERNKGKKARQRAQQQRKKSKSR